MIGRWPSSAVLGALFAFLAISSPATGGAAEAPTRFSGLVFADYFYNLNGGGVVKDSSGFRFRRIYLTADHDLSERITSRLTLEANEEALTSNGRSGTYVKNAYLQFKGVVPNGDLFAGMSSAPLWQNSEVVWGYRSVEKTSLDYRGFGAASDIGVAMKGTFGAAGPVGYHVMFANGNGQKPENDRSKKAYAAFPIKFRKGLIEPFADYEGGRDDLDKYTLKLLLGWMEEKWAVGFEGFRRNNLNAGPGGDDVTPTGVSVFGRAKVNDRWGGFARFDWYDPNAEDDAIGYRRLYVLAGLDFTPIPDVHLMPNLSVESYDGKSSAMPHLDKDVVARITLSYNYRE